jgi:hypothetical protein
MRSFYVTTALWATLTLCVPSAFEASYAGATDAAEKAVPQGEDPPGADNGEQQTAPLSEHKGVIQPPPTGDQGIYTEATNPNAGHKEEVIPPPGTPGGDPNVEPR